MQLTEKNREILKSFADQVEQTALNNAIETWESFQKEQLKVIEKYTFTTEQKEQLTQAVLKGRKTPPEILIEIETQKMLQAITGYNLFDRGAYHG